MLKKLLIIYMKDYKDHIDTSELFIFYKYENNNRIIVYASSYLEAIIELLFMQVHI